MTREKYIKYGVILVVVVLAFIFAMNIFGGKGNAKWEAKYAASEEREKAYAREIEFHRERADQAIAEKEKVLEMLKEKDSKLIIYEKKIPVDVRNYSKDILRDEVTGFKSQ